MKPRDMWHSLWRVPVPGSWAKAQHLHIAVPLQVLCFHTVLGVHTTMFPQPQPLLPSVFIARCWHKLPVRSQYTLPAVPGTILLSVADPQPPPRLITLRSSLPQPHLIMLRPCLQYPLGHSSLYSVTQLLVKAKPWRYHGKWRTFSLYFYSK